MANFAMFFGNAVKAGIEGNKEFEKEQEQKKALAGQINQANQMFALTMQKHQQEVDAANEKAKTLHAMHLLGDPFNQDNLDEFGAISGLTKHGVTLQFDPNLGPQGQQYIIAKSPPHEVDDPEYDTEKEVAPGVSYDQPAGVIQKGGGAHGRKKTVEGGEKRVLVQQLLNNYSMEALGREHPAFEEMNKQITATNRAQAADANNQRTNETKIEVAEINQKGHLGAAAIKARVGGKGGAKDAGLSVKNMINTIRTLMNDKRVKETEKAKGREMMGRLSNPKATQADIEDAQKYLEELANKPKALAIGSQPGNNQQAGAAPATQNNPFKLK